MAGATILSTIDSELEEICAGHFLRDVLSKWFVLFATDEEQFAEHEIETQGKPPKPKYIFPQYFGPLFQYEKYIFPPHF